MTDQGSTVAIHAPAKEVSAVGPPFGFNVIGHISGNVGVGVVARDTIRLIMQKGYPVATFDIDPGHGRSGHEATYADLSARSIDELPYGISLLILSITALPDILLEGRVTLRDDVVNAGYFWWELPVIPEIWVRSLEQFDVLVAGSQYLRSTFERYVSGMPAIYAQHGVKDHDALHADRAKFGLPSDKVIFVCIVEPTSDPTRKNPFAAVRAFQSAFSNDDHAHLVIKIINARAEVRPELSFKSCCGLPMQRRTVTYNKLEGDIRVRAVAETRHRCAAGATPFNLRFAIHRHENTCNRRISSYARSIDGGPSLL